MTVRLTEFAVLAVIAQLQAKLNEEIGHVNVEVNDGLDLPLVTGWRAYDAGVATPDVVEAEVFEIGDGSFTSEEYSQSLWHGGRTRVLSQVPLRAAINHANRGNSLELDVTLTSGQMITRSRRYLAALVRTLRNDPVCGHFANLVIVPETFRVVPRIIDRMDANVRRAGRVEFDFSAQLQESADNETVTGGAALPAATLETP